MSISKKSTSYTAKKTKDSKLKTKNSTQIKNAKNEFPTKYCAKKMEHGTKLGLHEEKDKR